nr:MAG TPA: protein of unknown function DUF1828 [Caudoviricetes sp.]
MSNSNIIETTKLENTPYDLTVYELLTNRLNPTNKNIPIYKVINTEGQCYLTDDGFTLSQLKRHGVEIKTSGETSDRLNDLLVDYYVHRCLWENDLYTGLYSEDAIDDEVTNFLNAIEAVYKEFLG